MRPGWFWRESENERQLSARELLQTYYTSVGRNCVLLLGVPPDTRGLIHENDVQELLGFKAMLDEIVGTNLLEGGSASSPSIRKHLVGWQANNVLDNNLETFWVAEPEEREASLLIQTTDPVTFNVIRLQEPIRYGQQVSKFSVHARDL